MSQGVGAVNALDGRVSALDAAFAGGDNALMGGGEVCGTAYGADWGEATPGLVVTKGLTIAALGVRVDGEVVFKTTHCVEEDQVADPKRLPGIGHGDGEDHGGVGLGRPVVRAGEPAGDLA